MKILFLSRYQNTLNRGAEVFVKEITKRLQNHYEVKILSGSESDSLKKILHEKPDLVVPINGRMQSLKVSLGRLVGKYRLLITGHSGIGRDDIWNILVAKPDVFVVLTSQMASWAKYFAWGSKIVKIPNGIDLKKFQPKGEKIKLRLEPPVILSVGALEWYKYHEKTINAVSKLDKGSVLLIGDGTLKDKLSKLGDKKLSNRFQIMNVSYENIPKIYRSADLFTLPSWDREAFGIVYLEAMASNLPVVAPNDLSRQEIIGNAGVLADLSNIDEYVDALMQVLNKGWDELPRKQAEKFSWDKIAMDYTELIESMFKK